MRASFAMEMELFLSWLFNVFSVKRLFRKDAPSRRINEHQCRLQADPLVDAISHKRLEPYDLTSRLGVSGSH